MTATLDLQRFVEESRRRPASLEQALVGVLFEHAAPALLEHFTRESLLALARRALALLAEPGELKVRVYNPERELHGWEVPYTVLELSLPDRPFIVDSVRAELKRRGLEVAHVLHPVLRVERAADGALTAVSGAAGRDHFQSRAERAAEAARAGSKEALELYLIGRLDSAEARQALAAGVTEVLRDVLLATRDYGAMRARAEGVAETLDALRATEQDAEAREALLEDAAFMRWLAADNFVFLGYREYDVLSFQGVPSLQVTPASGLGILSKESSAYREPVALAEIPEALRERVLGGRTLTVSKTNAEATVHRPVRMDYIGVKKVEGGAFVGERRFVGLFTSKALATPVEEIPILRRKLRLVLALDGAEPGSHDFKQIKTIFNSVPREELFWSDEARLQRDIRTVMAMTQGRGVRVTVRPDPLGRGLAVMVIMPRERFNAAVRRRVQAFLADKLTATHTDYQLAMGEDEEQVRFHFFFSTALDPGALEVGALEAGVAALTRTWADRLGELLLRHKGEAAGQALAARYLDAFDERYRADTAPDTALRDLENLERLAEAPFVIHVLNPQGPAHASQQGLGREASHLEVYHRGRTLVLSEVLPLLENLGLRVLEQVSYTFTAPELPTCGLDLFRVQTQGGEPLAVARDGARLREALLALLQGEAENDRLGRLVLAAGLSVRQVALLRALQRYLPQLRPGLSRSSVADALLRHPALAGALVRTFELKFAPEPGGELGGAGEARAAEVAAAATAFEEGLQGVASLADDETLRGLANLVEATVRTNYFLDQPYISFKLESARVSQMPEPRPLFEIAVSAPQVEGAHLRGGRVARGGLRWSDRPDDFRTEVLGLMKTQMTKNAPIVPVGSKGGFVLKGAPSDPAALAAFVRDAYQTYLRGLLDLTDNLVGGEPVTPAGLVVYDEPDAYLVVAADKGTATFSDLANETAAEYDFWLGDAFASGGSNGYDHKAEGITARGAWESVKRHFLELGVDVTREPITVVGIGDMSGDVFGNGLLYTGTLKLLAAFNHLHIFLDPDPDPATSFGERGRLFALPRSTWEDYDRSLVSAGGGVYSRFAKRIPLSQEVQAMLGVEAAALSGQDLVRAILKMPADLLWNGGVGTYVKASSEGHAEVGDSANNAVRVDACDLRVRVVGEGGNLGLTQLARVEYAAAGGRINTDAIDNSAGVDMSDHEVNLKIALQPPLAAGSLGWPARNALLREMTDEVSALVLHDNARQALALSLAQRRAARDPALFVSLQAYLAERGDLHPEVEFLPSAKTAAERPYTRPELAVLLAYTKMGLYRRLLETELPDEAGFQHYLFSYFPGVLQERFGGAIRAHPLRREIVATQITNAVVDRLGLSFVHRTLRDTGSSPAEVVRGALLAFEIFDTAALIDAILASGAPTESQYEALELVARAVEEVVAWLLLGRAQASTLARTVPDFVATYRAPLTALLRDLGSLLGHDERVRYAAQRRDYEGAFGADLAAHLVGLPYLPSALGVVDVARETGVDVPEAARRFYELGERLGLGGLRDALLALPTRNRWEKIALRSLVVELRQLQVALSVRYLESGAGTPDAFLGGCPHLLKRFDATLSDVRRSDELGLASGGVLRGTLQALLSEL